ncbi:MAG: TetR/AcrR family transcriptional regulator [Candidatus Scalindua sp.]|nr:TetR/AcrR family transcriptional regulator [Candidatus Scalindua sp.]
MNKKTAKKNEIINASINLMYLKGYNGTSVKDITDAAGIPKGSFYNHFEDKEHYAVDAINYYYQEVISEFTATLVNQNLGPLDRIKEFCKQVISWLEQQDFKLGCFVGNMTQEMGDVSELISDAVANIHKDMESRIHKNLVEAYENRALKKELSLKALASFIVSSWQGSLLRMKETGDRTSLDAFYTVLTEDLLK